VGISEALKWASSGSLTIEYPDGRKETLEAGGRKTLFVPSSPNSSSGETTVWYTSGAIEVTYADGSKLLTQPDGTTVATDVNSVVTVTPASEDTIYTETGDVKIEEKDDQGNVLYRTTYKVDGSVEEESFEADAAGVWQRTTLTTYAPTGTVTRQEAEAASPTQVATTIQQYNGTVIVENPDGSGTEVRLDGTSIKTEADGTTFTLLPDKKTLITEFSDGSVITRNADGSVTAQPAENSAILIQDASMDWTATLSGDRTMIWKNDGSGTILYRMPEEDNAGSYSILTHYLDGKITLLKSDGSLSSLNENGSTITRFLDGRVLVQEANDENVLLDSSGKRTFLHVDGTEETVYTTGLRELLYTDGSLETYYLSGVKITRNSDKSILVEAPDGSKLTKSASGNLTAQLVANSEYITRITAGDYQVKISASESIHILGIEPGSIYGNEETASDDSRYEYLSDGTIVRYRGIETTKWYLDGRVEVTKGNWRTVWGGGWENSKATVVTEEQVEKVYLDINGIEQSYKVWETRYVVEPNGVELEFKADQQYVIRVPEVNGVVEMPLSGLKAGYWDSIEGRVSGDGTRKFVKEGDSEVSYVKGETSISKITYRTVLINGSTPDVQAVDYWGNRSCNVVVPLLVYYDGTALGERLEAARKAGYKFVVKDKDGNFIATNSVISTSKGIQIANGMKISGATGGQPEVNILIEAAPLGTYSPSGLCADGATAAGAQESAIVGVGQVSVLTGSLPMKEQYKIIYENCSDHIGEPGYGDMVAGEGIREIISNNKVTDLHRCKAGCHWIFNVGNKRYHSDIPPIKRPNSPPGNGAPEPPVRLPQDNLNVLYGFEGIYGELPLPAQSPVWPIFTTFPDVYISSRFGPRILGTSNYHYGIDIVAPSGTPIMAIMSGMVVDTGNDEGGYGKYVVIFHKDRRTFSIYGHQSSINTKAGKFVSKGEIIGFVGNTGHSFGDHLHLGIYQSRDKICWDLTKAPQTQKTLQQKLEWLRLKLSDIFWAIHTAHSCVNPMLILPNMEPDIC